jgi:hypothetical protein
VNPSKDWSTDVSELNPAVSIAPSTGNKGFNTESFLGTLHIQTIMLFFGDHISKEWLQVLEKDTSESWDQHVSQRAEVQQLEDCFGKYSKKRRPGNYVWYWLHKE